MKINRNHIRLASVLTFSAMAASAQPAINSLYPPVLSERVGDHVAYSVSATASLGSLSYEWYQAGNPTVISSSSTIVLANIQPANAGSYYVVVSDTAGSTQSGNVTLNVLPSGALGLYSSNIVVARVGDGAQTLSGATGNTLYLDQYQTNGTYVDSIQIPDEGLGLSYGSGSVSSANLPAGSVSILISGANVAPGNDAGNEAFLGRAPTGLSLSFGGYCLGYPYFGSDVSAEPGGNGGNIWRGIATVDAFGYYTMNWTNTGLYSGGNHQFHSVIDIDGNATNYYTTGEAGSANSIKYCNINNEPANGSGIQAVVGSLAGTRVVEVVTNNLVFSDQGLSPVGIYACSGLPQTTASAALLVADTNKPMDFAFSPDLKTVYVADNGTFTSLTVPAGGVQRWDEVGSSYHYSYTLQMGPGSAIGARGLTVDFGSSAAWGAGVIGAKLYVTTAEASGNRLLRIVDSGAASSAAVLITATTNEMLCGIRFGPVFVPPSFSVQPQPQTAPLGSTLTFSSLAIGTGPLTYQWYFQTNGAGVFAAITNATNAILNINATAAGNVGNYYAVTTDPLSITAQSQTASYTLPGTAAVAVTLNTQSPGLTIPTNFLGLSFETANLKYNGVGVNGYMFDSSDTDLITLFANLGIKHLRMGGTTTDTNNEVIPFYFPTNQDIDALFRFVPAAGVQTIVSLQLEHGIPSADAALGAYTWTNYHQYMSALAIGNEPEAYGGSDPYITNFTSYFTRWTTFENAILQAAPGAKFVAVDGTETSWPDDFAADEAGSSNIVEITSHFYFGGGSGGLTASQVISGMLSANWDNSTYPTDFNNTVPVVAPYGFPYRVTEFNSYVANYPGVSAGNNSFAAALFSCDAAHWWAAQGSPGVDFHTFLGKYNATIYYDANGHYQVYPIGYGQAAFTLGSQGAVVPVTLSNTNSLNLTAYGVLAGTNLYVTIINKEYGGGALNASVTITPSGFGSGTVQAMYLTAPNGVNSTNDVTLGGAYITNNAAFQPQWTPLGLLTNGQCVVSVPVTSAAIVLIQATSLSRPPLLTANLPGQLRINSGNSYTLSVTANGPSPLIYQWYDGTNLINGATNSSYTPSIGAAGSSSNYFVVISNSYGVVTSAVSTLTVVPAPAPLIDYYGREVLSYSPIGYWPLQETNAPAPGNWETNYGTLGSLGNAYYACTNATNAVFGEPGVLAGSSDPCVLLSGADGADQNSYAFVPRLNPALTLQGPFSLEAWVNMANNSYMVHIGEGGGTGLNGSANYAGFQLGEGVQGAGNQFQMNYFTGNGNAQIEEQETSLLFNVGQWYHYVVTFDGLNSILFVNGQPIYGGTTSMAPDSWSPLAIGGGKWDYGTVGPSRWFDGYLDEVAIYTNVLAAQQISNHYQAGISSGSNYFQTITNARPLLYYRMDSPGYVVPTPSTYPTALNFGSSQIDGFYPGGIVPGGLSGPPIAPLGPKSVAAPINGVISCVDAGFNSAYNPTGTQPFTAMTWFRTYPADGRIQTIMSHGGAASWTINLLGNSGNVSWNSGAGQVISTNILNDGSWHFVAGIYDGANNYLYVDGVLNSSSSALHGITGNTTDDVFLGGDPDYTLVGSDEQYLSGAVAQAAFFSYAFTASEVQALYRAAMQAPPPLSLAIQPAGSGKLQLTWNYGELQTATNVTGPYNDLSSAISPLTIMPTNMQQFYRLSAVP